MENPATWGPVEHAVNEALEEHRKLMDLPVVNRPIGLSLPAKIAGKLRSKGLVTESAEPFVGSARLSAEFFDIMNDHMRVVDEFGVRCSCMEWKAVDPSSANSGYAVHMSNVLHAATVAALQPLLVHARYNTHEETK